MANYISVTSTNRGKSTHKLIENHLNNEDDKSVGVTNVVALGLFRLIKPYLARIDNINCLEEYLYSKEIGVAGQVDCVAEYKGKLSIIDFKTSTKRRDADYNYGNFLQCSAYAKMFEEMYPDKKIEQTVVLATCESGEVQEWLHTEDKIKEHQELFYKHTQEFLERHKESLVEITK
jgi:genome maintenance exonuclease 1